MLNKTRVINKTVFKNERFMNEYLNEKLSNIGVNDISLTWKSAFYSVPFKEDGGTWKLFFDKKANEYIETISIEKETQIAVHFHVIDENNGTLKITKIDVKPVKFSVGIRLYHTNIMSLDQLNKQLLSEVQSKLSDNPFVTVTDLTLHLTTINTVIAQFTYSCPLFYRKQDAEVLISETCTAFDDKNAEIMLAQRKIEKHFDHR